jgi:hypothetical protein
MAPTEVLECNDGSAMRNAAPRQLPAEWDLEQIGLEFRLREHVGGRVRSDRHATVREGMHARLFRQRGVLEDGVQARGHLRDRGGLGERNDQRSARSSGCKIEIDTDSEKPTVG